MQGTFAYSSVTLLIICYYFFVNAVNAALKSLSLMVVNILGFSSMMVFLKRQCWQNFHWVSRHFSVNIWKFLVFLFALCSLQLLPFSRSVLEMTSRQWERRASPCCFRFQFVTIAAATSCQSGSSCVHSFLCARSKGVTKLCVYTAIYGVLWTMGTGLPPK